MDHCLILGTEVGLAAMERWIIGSLPDSWDRGWSGSVGAMDHLIIALFLGQRLAWQRWSDRSFDHSLTLGTEVGLAAMERRIIGSKPNSWDRGWSRRDGAMDHWIKALSFGQRFVWQRCSDGSLDHSLILGTEVGLAAM